MTHDQHIAMMARVAPYFFGRTPIEMLVEMQAWLRSMQAGVL